ncbi:MAG: 2-amino-4-hydroxy-6-hydroxymethyldihydropteridine diphosphokinase [Prolixibacteraceae bacterium]|nr:2-amino-4-hydroxy-6-hydroxymethyldihydropteridine diphosphokinase [Prolixibacteraceae bacterium]MBN2650116.1 2-amino-4-hydroxy-6-hydroxymethyldihydropteridine diphosphokinase [Prolixibacteraceae bacterium]
MNCCIVEMGSNIEPDKNIEQALSLLRLQNRIIAVSTVLTTSPLGITHQPDFRNGAVKIETSLSQSQFKLYLKKIEDELKRDRNRPKFGPRTIDLDIIVWNGKVIDNDYYERDFVKQTVDEIK